MLIFDQFKKEDRPLWSLTVSILTGMFVLLGGLWYLQVLASQRYVQTQKNQSVRQVRFPAMRGKILDRNGVALAENRPAYNINLYLEELSPLFAKEFARQRAAYFGPPVPKSSFWQRIFTRSTASNNSRRKWTLEIRDELWKKARYLVASNIVYQTSVMLQLPVPLEEKRFQSHYGNRRALPMPVLDNLTPEQVAMFLEQPNKPPGLNLDKQGLRVYTNGTLAAHLLGHVQRIENITGDEDSEVEYDYSLPDYEGKVGIEGAFDQELRGHAGAKSVVVNNMGFRQSETVWSPAEPGKTIVLTIDARIQRASEQALSYHGTNVRGAVVVMDPRNGDLLALASSPTYDPNAFIPSLTPSEAEWLNDTNGYPSVNRATFGAYAPGSIFKIVIGLAGLEAGTLDPKEIIRTHGFYQPGRGKPIKDLAAPGDYDFRLAFLKSSNEYFCIQGLRAGMNMGLARIMDMGARFFIGQRTGVPIMQELGGFLPSPKWVEKQKVKGNSLQLGDVAQLCIGQGYLTVTPLQIAVMTAAVANGGRVLWPRLVERVEPRETNAFSEPVRAFPSGQIRGELRVHPKNLQIIHEAMLADVEDASGTGKPARVNGLRVCGKTGTAQFKSGGVSRLDVWFASFADYEDPRYVVVVCVEGGASGGGTCAPLAHQIYQAIKQIESQRSPLSNGLAQSNSPP